ncbi:hypothetical protein D3C80_1872410 [compost metagenome]
MRVAVVVGHMLQHQHDAQQADGQVDQEYPVPRKHGHQQAAQRRADHGAEQCWHGQKGHGPHQVGLAGAAQQDVLPDRHHQRAAGTLAETRQRKLQQRGR